MQSLSFTDYGWSHEETLDARRQRALERLAELIRLHDETAQTRAGDRHVPLPMLRRAVFAAYREAADTGAGEEAARLLRAPRSAAGAADLAET
jgi:hypothetical protein